MTTTRIWLSMAATIALGLATGARATETKPAGGDAAAVASLNAAMTPGAAQKRLDFLVGDFDVKVLTWLDPAKPPYESIAVAVSKWVLGDRYIQTMLSGFIGGEPWAGIGYAGFDNVQKKYVATYMDSGSTGMEWYSGAIAEDGKAAKMTATIYDAVTHKPTKVEMRLRMPADGSHVTEYWQANPAGKMVKVMELQYTRRK
jgi:hypothetical protein